MQSAMHLAIGYVVVLALAGTTTPVRALADAQPAAQTVSVNSASFDTRAVDTLFTFYQLQRKELTRQVWLDEAIDNHLLAREARQNYAATELYPGAPVGYPAEVAVEERLLPILRMHFKDQLKSSIAALPGGNVDSLVTEFVAPASDAWKAALSGRDEGLLEFAMSEQERRAADKITVLRYRLSASGTERVLTLAEVFSRQNVQGRIALRELDSGFLRQQAYRYVAIRYLLDRAVAWESPQFLQSLRTMLADEGDAQALMRWYGLGSDADGDSRRPDALIATVTDAEVHAYHEAHKETFRQVDRVKAYHIRVASEAEANAVVKELDNKPATFTRVARQRSIASDAKSGGDLGWIKSTPTSEWLTTVIFMQEPGVISSPIRTPTPGNEEAPWEIVLVEKREESVLPATSETVAWVARNQIAKDKAAAEYRNLLARLRKTASIPVQPVAPAGSVP